MAHPTDLLRGYASDEGERRDISRNDGTRSDEAIFAECRSTNDRGIGTYRRATPDKRWSEFVFAFNLCPRIPDVRKDTRRATENTVFQCDAGIDTHVVLDLAAIADNNIGADHYILSDSAIFTDDRILENMGKMPDFCAFSDSTVAVNNCK